MKLSIVIPAYNEEHRLTRMLDAYVPYFTTHYGDQVEFIVVVNGSTDGTAEVARAYDCEGRGVRVLEEAAAIGKGGAVMLGFAEARGDRVGFTDADGSTPPEAFDELVKNIGDAGIIIASRWLPGSDVSPRQPLSRRVASRIFNFLVRMLFKLRITDTQCGAKLLSRQALDEVVPKLGLTRWAFDVDLLFQVRRAHYDIREIPTTWHDVEGSKIRVVRASMDMFLAICRLRLLHSPLRWVVRVYDKAMHLLRKTDRLLQDTVILVVASQVSNVANMVFQAVMGRSLNTEEYGVLATMLNVVNLAFIPLGALGAGASHFAARFVQMHADRQTLSLLRHWALHLAAPVVILLALVILGRDAIAGLFHLDDSAPVVITGFILAFTVFMPVFGGFLQGLQAFIWMSIVGIVWALLRLAAGWLFVGVFEPTAAWALAGQAVGAAGCLAVGMFGLRVVLHGAEDTGRADCGRTRAYVAGSVPPLAGLAVFMSGDMILTKYFFDPETAGHAARAFQIGRIMFFLVMPVVRALFPKVVSGGDTSHADWHMLLRGWLYSLAGVAAAVLGCCLLPQVPLWIFFGREAVTPEMQQLVRLSVCAMAPIGLLAVCVHFELAQKRFAGTMPVILCAVGYVAGVILRHDKVTDVMLMLGVFSAAALVISATLQILRARKLFDADGTATSRQGEGNS